MFCIWRSATIVGKGERRRKRLRNAEHPSVPCRDSVWNRPGRQAASMRPSRRFGAPPFLSLSKKELPTSALDGKRPREEEEEEGEGRDEEEDEDHQLRRLFFHNTELDEQGEPTKEYSYYDEEEAARAWIKFQFWSRNASERATEMGKVVGSDPVEYNFKLPEDWEQSSKGEEYVRELNEYFAETEQEGVTEVAACLCMLVHACSRMRATLLSPGHETGRRVQTSTRHWKSDNRRRCRRPLPPPHAGHQHTSRQPGRRSADRPFRRPHMLRNSLLAEWMPFIENKPESKGRFPLPEYRIGPNRRIK